MASFIDGNKQEWLIEFDGLLLADIESEAGVDLADFTGLGLAQIEFDAKSLVKSLVVLTREQREQRNVTPAAFSKLIVRDTILAARAAVRGAAIDFFPASDWCEIASRLDRREKIARGLAEVQASQGIQPLDEGFLTGMLSELGSSETSEESPSASGPASIPAAAVSD